MKMLVYREKFIPAEKDEEGNIVEESRNEKEMVPFELDNVLRVKVQWNRLEVYLINSEIIVIEDVIDIYYR